MRKLLISVLLLSVIFTLGAQVTEEELFTIEDGLGLQFSLEGIRWNFAWGADLIPTGLDLGFAYHMNTGLPGQTIPYAVIGGGYSTFETYTESNYTPNQLILAAQRAANPELYSYFTHYEFYKPGLDLTLGLRQGLAWNSATGRNLSEVFAAYHLKYEQYTTARIPWGTDSAAVGTVETVHENWQSSLLSNGGTDAEGIFGNTLLFGVNYDTLQYDPVLRLSKGTVAEASVEISPYIQSAMGATDFYRLNLSSSAFIPVYALLPRNELNTMSVNLAMYTSLDWTDAYLPRNASGYRDPRSSIPLYVLQSFGGTTPRGGLGGSVRGFETYAWNTQFKFVNNLELRLHGPALGFQGLVPGVLLYSDVGYGSVYWKSDRSGEFLASAGAAFFIDLFGVEIISVYFHKPLAGERLDRKAFVFPAISFGLHF